MKFDILEMFWTYSTGIYCLVVISGTRSSFWIWICELYWICLLVNRVIKGGSHSACSIGPMFSYDIDVVIILFRYFWVFTQKVAKHSFLNYILHDLVNIFPLQYFLCLNGLWLGNLLMLIIFIERYALNVG